MTISLKHAFQSAKGDGTDATRVQPSNWNAEHTITLAADSVIGRGATAGAATEIPCTSFGRSFIAAASASAAYTLLGLFPSGTKMLFQQTSAPTGWTKDTTHNNKALRVVSGTASSGGTVAFTTAFASKSVTGTVGDTTLTIDQIPSHTHGTHNVNLSSYVQSTSGSFSDFIRPASGAGATQATGGGNSHTHTFTGTAIDLAVQYVDLIIATKD